MQVIFIHHSCFLIEVDDAVLIFDYFDGEHVEGYSFKGRVPQYAPDTKIYLFASHSHRDHYDMETLSWAEKYENIHYILTEKGSKTAVVEGILSSATDGSSDLKCILLTSLIQ